MKPHLHFLWLVSLLALIFAVSVERGLQYRIKLFDRELQKFGGHYRHERVIEPVEMQYGNMVPPIDMQEYVALSESLLADGQLVYEDYCLSCHGTTGLGDGEVAPDLESPPRSFSDTDGWLNGSKVSEIFRTLTLGVEGSEDMLEYDFLTPAERFAVTHYVRSFLLDPPADTGEDLSRLDEEFQLSEGILEPNTIPLDLARQKILEEGAARVSEAERLAQRMRAMKGADDGPLSRYVEDEAVAATILTNSRGWEQNAAAFSQFIADDPLGKGFFPAVTRLGHADRERLFQALLAVNEHESQGADQ